MKEEIYTLNYINMYTLDVAKDTNEIPNKQQNKWEYSQHT